MSFNRRTFLQIGSGALGLAITDATFTKFAFAEGAAGTLRVAIAKPAGNLDPQSHYAIWAIQDLMFEPLVRYGKGGQIEPCLATDWKIEEGGKTLHLTLRQGVTFQDGTVFDAASCKWNLERWLGLDQFSWMNCSKYFQSLEVIDEHQIAVHFKEPPLALMQELSYTRPPRFLSPKSVDANGKFVEPVGTGPWRQLGADDTQSVFERYDGYWGDKPTYQRLEAKVIPDPRARVAALRAGEIDLVGGFWIAPLTPVEAKQLEAAGLNVVIDPGNVTLVMAFNPDRTEALKDPQVRKAVSIGIDRAAISQALYQGFARPAGNLFSDALPFAGTQHDAPVRDVAAASALLEKAGWTGGPVRSKDGTPLTLEIVVSPDAVPGSRVVAEVIQSEMKEIGINLIVRSVDHASKHTDMLERKYDLGFFLTYGAPYDPFGTVVALCLSTFKNDVEGKLFTDPANLDPLINAATAATGDQIAPSIQKVYDWLRDNDAIAPLVYVPSIWAHSKRVQGFTSPVTEYDMPYENIVLAE
ncbi:nickel ABC transporter substrate-binding protein [Mesorhizobium sp. L2C084A000]|uniref:nickel ABC transporter substrate-binding protein n=1 Tax=Mesorhizobium sp. L2C084A000 TaxID=1287116 RepID=UPI0003CFB857|nr:nickel ABC transporter substrate-binding protein [Mesorhizobium sp. L2C084A000]ESZ28714.1 ABC transporter substrate-binding protein [Mesorhizobium sp. L2C084A000]